jgi:hypothetical protein
MSWIEIADEIIVQGILARLIKVAVFFLWIVTKSAEILLHALNESMKKYLFPNRK